MALPTIDLMEVTPQFIKDHIFFVILVGDTAFTGLFNLITGTGFVGIIGGIISTVFSALASLVFGGFTVFVVHTWQIFFIFFVLQSGLVKLMFDMLVSRFKG